MARPITERAQWAARMLRRMERTIELDLKAESLCGTHVRPSSGPAQFARWLLGATRSIRHGLEANGLPKVVTRGVSRAGPEIDDEACRIVEVLSQDLDPPGRLRLAVVLRRAAMRLDPLRGQGSAGHRIGEPVKAHVKIQEDSDW